MSLRPSRTTAGYGRLVDIEAVAAELGVHIRHVRRLVHERRIPYVKWGTCSASTPPRSMPGSTAPVYLPAQPSRSLTGGGGEALELEGVVAGRTQPAIQICDDVHRLAASVRKSHELAACVRTTQRR